MLKQEGQKNPKTGSERKNLLIVTAVVEAGAGLVFLVLPSAAAKFLFGSTLDAPAALTVGRLTGAALMTLGIACLLALLDLESRATAGLVFAMFVYNLAALAILASAGAGLGLVGVLLWLGVVFHTLMALWCLVWLQNRRVNASREE